MHNSEQKNKKFDPSLTKNSDSGRRAAGKILQRGRKVTKFTRRWLQT